MDIYSYSFNDNDMHSSLQQVLKSTTMFLAEHSSTIIVSSAVFIILSVLTSVLTREPKMVHKGKPIGPQPKWEVLKALNYVVLGLFVGSISYAVFNYRRAMSQPLIGVSPITNMFWPVILIWTLCLAYFFGFFGISFVDKEMLQSPSAFDLSTLDSGVQEQTQRGQRKSTESQMRIATKKPFESGVAPICSDGPPVSQNASSHEESAQILSNIPEPDYPSLSDEEVLSHILNGTLKDYQLEKKLGDYERAVSVRRQLFENILEQKLDLIPFTHFDYNKVFGANCEIVVGYVPIPVGIVGPLLMNGSEIYVPMATTEGCLVASTNRGCKAISSSGGCNAVVLKDGITRAPCVRLPSAMRAAALKLWVSQPDNFKRVAEAFNSTTSFGRLETVDATVAGRDIFLRFCCTTGDAMGMNMVSKGCLKAIELIESEFPDAVLVAISGNMCTDKKPAAINWILGRGKSVVAEVVIPEKIVKNVLKTSVKEMIETNTAKNHIGSAMAGAIGGFNAHAANIVTALFLATGQDPAQNVESSNCITIMELADDGHSLYASVTMPSIEVGTVGGGTNLPAQAGCLQICGVRGASKAPLAPGDNARQLAQIVACSVLAGEISLMAALSANHLVRSHMQHNRKPTESVPSPAEQIASAIRKTESCPNIAGNA